MYVISSTTVDYTISIVFIVIIQMPLVTSK